MTMQFASWNEVNSHGRKKKTKHLGGSKEAKELSCWNVNNTELSWESLFWFACHAVIPVTGHNCKCVSHYTAGDWPTCSFLCLASCTFTSSSPSPPPFLWGKNPKHGIEWTSQGGKRMAFWQCYIPLLQRRMYFFSSWHWPPFIIRLWKKRLIVGIALGSWNFTDLI